MGYYQITCKDCGGPAIFFSVGSMWIDCQTCAARKKLVDLLAVVVSERAKGGG